MKTIQIHQYGGPEVLQRIDAPVPEAAPGSVLVRVHHAGINFMDIHTRQGKYEKSRTYPVRLPCTLGMEGAGEVVALGEGVTTHRIGDRVAWCIVWGSYAEYAVVPAWQAVKVPEAVRSEGISAPLVAGVIAAAISSWLAITVLLRYVSKHSFGVFAVYRVILAAVVFATIATRA